MLPAMSWGSERETVENEQTESERDRGERERTENAQREAQGPKYPHSPTLSSGEMRRQRRSYGASYSRKQA